MGTGTDDKVDTQEVEEDNEKNDDFESQISLNSLTHDKEASKNMENGHSDQFGTVRTVKKTSERI